MNSTPVTTLGPPLFGISSRGTSLVDGGPSVRCMKIAVPFVETHPDHACSDAFPSVVVDLTLHAAEKYGCWRYKYVCLGACRLGEV